MNPQRKPHIPVSLEGLNQKLDIETKRLLREKEEGVVKRVSKKAILGGNSTLVFTNKAGAKIALSYRLNEDGNLRLAYEKRFANISFQNKNRSHVEHIGRASKDIGS